MNMTSMIGSYGMYISDAMLAKANTAALMNPNIKPLFFPSVNSKILTRSSIKWSKGLGELGFSSSGDYLA